MNHEISELFERGGDKGDNSKIISEWSAVCDRARGLKVALLAVGVGQGWGAVEAV